MIQRALCLASYVSRAGVSSSLIAPVPSSMTSSTAFFFFFLFLAGSPVDSRPLVFFEGIATSVEADSGSGGLFHSRWNGGGSEGLGRTGSIGSYSGSYS